jgi:hypothetical protein
MTYKQTLLSRYKALEAREHFGYEITIVVLLAACVLLAFYAHSATQLQAEQIANDCLFHGKSRVDGVNLFCGRTK